MNIDRRFAIVIGINDYDLKPLNFCVNDAMAVVEILEKRCFFKKEDIFSITSTHEKSTKEISGRLDKILETIQDQMKSHRDSIFFYFAGHGIYQEKSKLQFHDLSIEIKTIFDKINSLNPKNQFYVIDACESGGKVITRKSAADSLIDQFITNSSGIYFMFASTETQSAFEKSDLGHGVFTNYFIQAIENQNLYDEDGILTPGRIQEYVSKKTQTDSKFDQIPVIESRTAGYYPFAYTEEKIEETNKMAKVVLQQIPQDTDNGSKKEYFPQVPAEKRVEIFEALQSVLPSEIKNILTLEQNYTADIGENLSIFNSSVEDEITKSIVSESLKKRVISIEDVFSVERVKINHNPRLQTLGMLNSLFSSTEPEYRTDYYISFFDNSKIISHSIFLKSVNLNNVSAGLNFTIYQSLYGIGLASTSFFLDYDGYKDTKIKGLTTKIDAYIVNENIKTNILKDLKENLKSFNSKLATWNDGRKGEIESFRQKAKS
ncbi:caspase family protein [Chryseobacterium gambrini]|uniref:Caspase domain-containing protein n=1 Tax=Chryseobacterium gambrini TaxID=373672 RepID=A0A1N7KQM4_9FLAO|nr:caspase family protein [Chryseobacterium gambrini]SIS63841.1 Caspase domain-containing protein [Chryseobacterium gambrini]